MDKSLNDNLIAICKRIDKLESLVDKRKFIKRMVDSITDIVYCDYCGKIVMARIDGIKWSRDGFFQVGTLKNRIASWCSDNCEKKYSEENPNY